MSLGKIIESFSDLLGVFFVSALTALPLLAAEKCAEADAIKRSLAKPATTIDLRKDCGAKGDGLGNDTAAFQKAAALLQAARGGRLVIPKGVYVVGEQVHEAGGYPYYKQKTIFQLDGVTGLIIEGKKGAVIRLANGLRYGSFDKETGEPFDPKAANAFKDGLFADARYATYPGNLFTINNSTNVVIRDLELDGNSRQLIVGGMYGDTGRQLPASGLCLYGNTGVLVERVNTHDQGLDGIMIGCAGLKATDAPNPHLLVDVVSEYNARQGLSWVGGRGLTAVACRFNHTGRRAFQSAPGAGVDIEAEDSVCRDGVFRRCEFVNNAGCGLVADSGDGGYTRFEDCTFWGTTGWATWNRKPGMVFEGCRFYGSIVHAYGSTNAPSLATRYTRCRFEDKPHPEFGVSRMGLLVTHDGNADNVRFERCELVAHAVKSVWLAGAAILDGCTFTHENAGAENHDFQALFRGCELRNCRFIDAFPAGCTNRYYVLAQNVKVGTNVVVQGPVVRWENWSAGPTGVVSRVGLP